MYYFFFTLPFFLTSPTNVADKNVQSISVCCFLLFKYKAVLFKNMVIDIRKIIIKKGYYFFVHIIIFLAITSNIFFNIKMITVSMKRLMSIYIYIYIYIYIGLWQNYFLHSNSVEFCWIWMRLVFKFLHEINEKEQKIYICTWCRKYWEKI